MYCFWTYLGQGVTGQALAWSRSASGQPVVCGFFTLCRKDFTTRVQVIPLKLYLFLERGGGRGRGRETSVCDCLLRVPYWGPGPQPRPELWLGTDPATLWLSGRHSIHWATPDRVSPGDSESIFSKAGDGETKKERVEVVIGESRHGALLWLPREVTGKEEQGRAAVSSRRSQRRRGPWKQDHGVSPRWAAAAHVSPGCESPGDPQSWGGN